MKDKQTKVHFIELLIKAYDGQISPDEVCFLNDSVRNNPEAVKWCVEFFDDVSVLIDTEKATPELQVTEFNSILLELSEFEKTAPGIEIPKERSSQELIQKVVYPPREKYKMSAFNKFVFAAAAAMVLFFVYLRFAPQMPSRVDVASVVDQMDVKWTNTNTNLENGNRVWTNEGMLDLKKGIIRIYYDSGVDVLIEGPASFEFERSGVYLEYGRLYSRVSESGLGFTVNTPTAQFIDQGTEFGIQADVNGSSELHVIKGKVQLFTCNNGGFRTSQMVTENKAVRYNANSHTVNNILIEKNVFVRQINSAMNTVWRGQKHIDLADIVGGGTGLGGGVLNTGVDVATGKMGIGLQNYEIKLGSAGYVKVDDSPFIDGVFVPGLDEGMTSITSDGSIYANFPSTGGKYWGYILNGAFHEGYDNPRHTLRLQGLPFGTKENPSICIHSNLGITFDLLKIRETVPGMEIKGFSSLAGISETVSDYGGNSNVVFWIFLDGRKVFGKQMRNSDASIEVNTPIAKQDRFLTLAVTETIDGYGYDWALLGRPKLIIEPIK